MNILIANDDGIKAEGIHALADALAQIPDVNIYVSAPDSQRSCCGHALTMREFVEFDEIKNHDFNEKVKRVFTCSGVPADCVRIALYRLRTDGVKIDLVCSGINHGANLGTDFFYSGTLAAAREASVCFTQAIAFSVHSHDNPHFDVFKKLVPEVVSKTYGRLPADVLLNVNVPNIPEDEIKGIRVCRQGPMNYSLDYREETVDGKIQYILDADLYAENSTDEIYDGVCESEGYITLVPCDLLPFNSEMQQKTADLGIKWKE